MIFIILFLFFLISIILAYWSLLKQKKLKELEYVQGELKKKKVIYHHSSSSEESEE